MTTLDSDLSNWLAFAGLRYQLTIGEPASAWIGSEISNHMFVIKTDRSNIKVFVFLSPHPALPCSKPRC